MYAKNTRFSYERRVKLIFLCFIVFAAAVSLCAAALPAKDLYLPPERINLIRTSNSQRNYSVFEAARDKISARGMYKDDHVRKLFIDREDSDEPGTYSMKAHEDGSYEAEITFVPAEQGEHKLAVKLNSGAVMKYYIFYDSDHGWYFPKNGFAESNRKVFDHVFEASDEAAALYLSAAKDPDEIASALEQIKLLTDQATAGLDDDYEKARAISRFISEKVYYDHDAKDTSVNISTVALSNVLKSARTVCAGFSNLFCAMAEAAGIDAVNIKGGVQVEEMRFEDLEKGQQNHEWAAFYYEAERRWVWADPCWDGSGNYKNGELKPGKPKYMYFDMSDEAFALSHRADKAERRHYFSAKAETGLIGTAETDEEEKQPVITSEQLTEDIPDETGTDFRKEETEEITEPDEPDNMPDSVYITIIAALAGAVITVGAILIIIIVKGRKM